MTYVWGVTVADATCPVLFFFSSRRRHTRWPRDWSSDVCSSDLLCTRGWPAQPRAATRECRDSSGSPRSRESTTRASRRASHEIGRASCRERVYSPGGAGQDQQKEESERLRE